MNLNCLFYSGPEMSQRGVIILVRTIFKNTDFQVKLYCDVMHMLIPQN